MGHKQIKLIVYSCDCGWIGETPLEQVVDALGPGEMGRVVRGSRGAKKAIRFSCPLCEKPIVPSPPRDLLEAETVAQIANGGAPDP